MDNVQYILFFVLLFFQYCYGGKSNTISHAEKSKLKDKVIEMFDHAYGAYKKYAHPADELMPLSCRGRYRGSEADRGDIDEALGNFSLTLIDTLDTLVVLGQIKEFETQVKYVIENVSFDTDAVVSVFETNIRVLGGLLGAHSMAITLKKSGKNLQWYQDELLVKATKIADILLLAFNTTTGIPYPKVNLRYGLHHAKSRVGHETHTCTACAGTMIMEFGALSRLTGNHIYEQKAHKAMEALWTYRSRHSNLVGTTINIHSGDWTRRDSGVGAGIDSYYEYCLKAYILLGDESYRDKFNQHYAAIKKYIRQGYMLLDVYMHQPDTPARSFVDALQAFWPGLQVLKGDLKPAIETHEMLYNVAKKYKFLPEAFTTNFDLHWAQHPLRPEFIESTYFLYQATKDPYYLEVGKHVIDTMEEHARVKCGYAAFKDLRTFAHEDKMDSFVLAETFKYLYLLFSEESEHSINIHDFVFTTEAHLLPLYLSVAPTNKVINESKQYNEPASLLIEIDDHYSSCPNTKYHSNMNNFAEVIRKKVNSGKKNGFPSCKQKNQAEEDFLQIATEKFLTKIKINSKGRLRRILAKDFDINNHEHLSILSEFGIKIQRESNGKIQLQHQSNEAKSIEDGEEGILFMQEMVQIAKERGDAEGIVQPRMVKLTSDPFNGNTQFVGGYAQFGFDLEKSAIQGELIKTIPYRACQNIQNSADVVNRIAVVERGGCMFIDKARLLQKVGAIGIIIVDHNKGTSSANAAPFGMSGDNNPDNVSIAAVFLFNVEGEQLLKHMDDIDSSDGSKIRAILMKEKKAMEPPKSNDQAPSMKNEDTKIAEGKEQTYDHAFHLPNELFTDTRTNLEITTEGKKIKTTVSEYMGPNKDGILKRFVRTIIETCPTVKCNSIGLIATTKEFDAVYSKVETNTKQSEIQNGRGVIGSFGKQKIDVDPTTAKDTKEPDETYIDDFVSDVLKKQLLNKELIGGKGDLICSSAGCFETLKDLKDIQTLANSIMKMKSKLDKTKVTEALDKMQEDVKDNIEQTLREKNMGIEEPVEDSQNEEDTSGTFVKGTHSERTKPEL